MPSPPTESWPPENLTAFLLQYGLIPELDETPVEIPPGFVIRRAFQRPILLNADGTERVTFVIRTDPETRKPRVFEARHQWSRGCEVEDITEERLRQMAGQAIAEEAVSQAEKRMMGDASVGVSDRARDFFPELPETLPPGVAVLHSAELTRVEQRALRAVRPKPGPKPVEDERKLEALKWYREGGIPLAIERTGKAERTLRRWIADARKLEQEGR